jgi:autotransporter translocation and assembly factor TamB
VAVQGTLRGEGGSFELAAGVINRRFQIESAELRFFGSPKPNPRLNIVASRLVRTPDGGDVTVEVVVSGTLENPSLGLATASGPAIPESELLSFLLFGRPTSDLSQVAAVDGVGGLLGQSVAYTGLAEVLFAPINEELGVLDYFQLDYLPGGGIFAIAGAEVVNDVFINANFPVGAQSGVSALGLEWRSGVGTIRGALEPVERRDRLVGARTLAFIESDVRRQWILAWRRRWNY